VVPILLDFQKYAMPAAAHVREQFDDEKINILFVGRITPNKKQEDVIKHFIYTKHTSTRMRACCLSVNTKST
jgi:glycosyltransferase involved in cell wall biosynthesis